MITDSDVATPGAEGEGERERKELTTKRTYVCKD